MTVFVDSNIPMYLVGADHPNKERAQVMLDQLIVRGERLVTDAEVLQEILRRYGAIKRLDAIPPAFDAIEGVVDDVLPVTHDDVSQAKDLVLAGEGLTARHAVHVAVMSAHEIHRILTFDAGFDSVDAIDRVH